MFPERQGAPDEILPHARLRFVHAQGGAVRERSAFIREVYAAFVERVTRLVHGAEQGRVEEFLIEARGDTHVVDAEGGAERMRGLVLAVFVPVKTKGGDNLLAEGTLFGFGKFQVQEGVVHLLLFGNGLNEPHLFLAKFGKDGLNFSSLHAGFVIVEQGVVGMVGLWEEANVAAGEVHHFGKVRLEDGIVGLGAGFHPALVRGGRDLGLLGHELGRDARPLIVLAARNLDEREFVRFGMVGILEFVKQFTHFCIREFFVGDLAERAHLLAARFRAAARHVGLLVPAEHGRGAVQVVHFGEDGLEFVEFVLHGRLLGRIMKSEL